MSMAGRLEGKTAIVTSAGQGIGRASAICMAKEGAKVWATDINADTLASLAGEQKGIETFTLNVLKQDEVDAAAAKVGTPDILFNCSGYVHAGTIMETDEKAWDFSFDLNVKAHYRMIKAFMPGWLTKGQGVVVNMASAASSIKGVPNRFVYGATKAAVIGMTKALAADFTAKGIRVNAICPGTVDSPSLMERLKATGDFEAAKSAFISRQPMGRMARAEEIGMLVVYLASDEAAFVTGQTFVIDGGWSN
jgi:2-keto-3-deoxy-L-fuconate dehydrogenase